MGRHSLLQVTTLEFQLIRLGIVLLLTGIPLGCSKSKSESGSPSPTPTASGSRSPTATVAEKSPKTSAEKPRKDPKEAKLDPVEAFDRQMFELGLPLSRIEETFDPAGIRIYSVRPSAGSIDLAKLTNPPFPFGLRLGLVKFADADLVHLKRLTNLRWLWLSGQDGVTDEGLALLQDLTGLQELFLERSKGGISDAGLAHLSKMTELRRLVLRGNPNVTDEGMKHLAALTKLRWIDLWWTKVTDAGLRNLKEMHDLIYLNMPGVTDSRIAMLCEFGVPHALIVASTDADMTRLSSRAKSPKEVIFVDLSSARITDATLERLNVFENLEELHLTATKITDTGLMHLHGLKKLKRLSLAITPVTDDAVSRLKKALPKCDIKR